MMVVAHTQPLQSTTYNPNTGELVLEIGSHSLTTSNTVTIANNGVTFTCDADNNATNHSYPRATDPASGQQLAVLNPTATTITVNVGIANADNPTDNHTYPRSTDYASDRWLDITNITEDTFDVSISICSSVCNFTTHICVCCY